MKMTVYLADEWTIVAEVRIDENQYENFAKQIALTGYRIMRFVDAESDVKPSLDEVKQDVYEEKKSYAFIAFSIKNHHSQTVYGTLKCNRQSLAIYLLQAINNNPAILNTGVRVDNIYITNPMKQYRYSAPIKPVKLYYKKQLILKCSLPKYEYDDLVESVALSVNIADWELRTD